MAPPLSYLEQSNLNYLAEHGIHVPVVRLTSNMLEHSIMDANQDLRNYLSAQGLHCYEKQPFGKDNKVEYPTSILTYQKSIPSVSTLYRAQGRGDNRIWFGAIAKTQISPDNLIAVFALDGTLYLINLSKIDLTRAMDASMDNCIKEFFKKYCSSAGLPE